MDPIEKYPPLSDVLPWRSFLPDGVVDLRGDGVLKGYWLVGPSPDSNDGQALHDITEQLGKSPSHLRTGDAIQIVFNHAPAPPPPALEYAHPAAALVMAEMRERFAAEEHWTTSSALFLSHQFERPITNLIAGYLRAAVEPRHLSNHELLREYALGRFRAFEDAVKSTIGLHAMTDEDRYRSLLHAVTYHDYAAALPEPDVPLNQALACEWQVNGLYPQINGWHLRPIVITAYPNLSLPQALAVLLEQPGHLTISIRYRCLSPYDAQKALDAEKPFWKQTVVGDLADIFKGFFGGQKDAGQDAYNQIADINEAIADAQSGTPFGTVSCVVVVRDRDPELADFRAHNYVGLLQGKNITARIETIGAPKAISTTWPGYIIAKREEWEANRHRIKMTGYNFFDFALPATYWQGTPYITNHLYPPNTPSPLVLSGTAGEPFYYPTHDHDGLGHTIGTGRSGSGKSTYAAQLICGVQSIPDSQVVLMDNGHSSFVLAHALGARYFDVGSADSLALCPLELLDDPNNLGLQFIMGWTERLCFRRNQFELDEEQSKDLLNALRDVRMRKADGVTNPKCRNLLDLKAACTQKSLSRVKRILDELVNGYGHIFGGEPTEDQDSKITVYELSALAACPKYISTPAKELILYKIMSRLRGKPAFVLWDEFWEAVGDDVSAAWFFQAIRTMRRQNCAFIGLTQNSVEITQSPHCTLLLSNMPIRLFFPDPSAKTPLMAASLYKMGLNPYEVTRIASAQRGEFFYKSSDGARLASARLGEIGQAICARTSHNDVEAARTILKQCTDGEFLDTWLRAQGLSVLPTRETDHGPGEGTRRVAADGDGHTGANGAAVLRLPVHPTRRDIRLPVAEDSQEAV
jgi:type IV secretion system protein TrbE